MFTACRVDSHLVCEPIDRLGGWLADFVRFRYVFASAGSAPLRGPPRRELNLIRIQVTKQRLEPGVHDESASILEPRKSNVRDECDVLNNGDLADVGRGNKICFTLRVG